MTISTPDDAVAAARVAPQEWSPSASDWAELDAWLASDASRIEAAEALPAGANRLSLRFVSQGPYRPARAEILQDGRSLASGDVPATLYLPLGIGEQLDAGRDLGVPVTAYATPLGEIEGDIRHISLRFDEPGDKPR